MRVGCAASLAFLGIFFAAPAMWAQTANAQSSPPPQSAAEPPACASRADVLGISRIVEIDTSAGPRFGDQYQDVHFLADGEVVLTFDDGPMRRYTIPILDALDAQCTKATFFAVGRMAIADPDMLKETARRGHTIGSHTWSHQKLKTTTPANATREIELGLSAVTKSLGAPVAPFFRFPYLADTKATLAHLESRGIGTFGIDIDSRDFRTRNPGTVFRNVLSQLDQKHRGIILFHDIQPSTAGALASLLAELKTRGYKVVHMVPKAQAATVAEYDAIADMALKAKEVAAKADPLATRAVTWPIAPTDQPVVDTSGDGADPARVDVAQSADTAPAARATRRNRKTDWSNVSDDPWQLKSFGAAGGP